MSDINSANSLLKVDHKFETLTSNKKTAFDVYFLRG